MFAESNLIWYWNEKAGVVPIIIDALLTIKKNFEKQMEKINSPIAILCLLKATLFGTTFIWKHLVLQKQRQKNKKINKKNNNYTINK